MLPTFFPKMYYFRPCLMSGNECFTVPLLVLGIPVSIRLEVLGTFREEAEAEGDFVGR